MLAFPQRSILLLCLNTPFLIHADTIEPILEISGFGTNITGDEITETQYATCKISTEELVAKAHTTVTRVFKGACNTSTIQEKFKDLEKKLMKELEEIKIILYSILEQQKDSYNLKNPLNNAENAKHINFSYKHSQDDHLSSRLDEISKLNGAVREILTNESSNFTYYWKIKDFDEKLSKWDVKHFERSPTFYVGKNGYAMYLKVTPKYFPDGTIFVSVGLTRGHYDSILKWPFFHSLGLEIIDHSPEHLRGDRQSRIWDPSTLCSEYFWGRPKSTGDPDNPECVGLSIPRKIIFSKVSSLNRYHTRESRYLQNGSMTVKLSVYF